MRMLINPEVVAGAASDLAGIGAAVSDAATAASRPTANILAAASDEISAAIADLFNAHGQAFQAINAEASNFHTRFANRLAGSAARYAGAESASQSLLDFINAPARALTGRPLIGDGANGTTVNGVGTRGGDGGLLIGNGGRGGDSTSIGATGGAGGYGGWLYGNGGRGGNGGPGYLVTIFDPIAGQIVIGPGHSAGAGGAGGSAIFFGNGGAGGDSGSLSNGGFVGGAGRGGNGGVFFGSGGNPGAGTFGAKGRDGLFDGPTS